MPSFCGFATLVALLHSLSPKVRVGPNLHDVCATGRFLRGFPLKEPVDSKHSRQNPIIELKNRRTFTLFTTFSGRVVVGMKDERLLR